MDSKGLYVCKSWSYSRHVGMVAAWIEGKRWAMTVLTVSP